jgi:hypothetical protein
MMDYLDKVLYAFLGLCIFIGIMIALVGVAGVVVAVFSWSPVAGIILGLTLLAFLLPLIFGDM